MKKVALYLLWCVLIVFAKIRQLMGAYLFIRPYDKDYLFRWYISPSGNGRFAKWYRKRFKGIFLHRFDASDPGRGVHSHPWGESWSLILRGSYCEHRPLESEAKNPDGTLIETVRIYYPGDINYLTRKDFHRVQLLTPKVWTLFIAGGLHGDEWEFMDEYGNRKPHGTDTPGD